MSKRMRNLEERIGKIELLLKKAPVRSSGADGYTTEELLKFSREEHADTRMKLRSVEKKCDVLEEIIGRLKKKKQ